MNPQSPVATYGAIAVSIVALLTFLGALLASVYLKNESTILLCVGAAVANATTVVGYWLGSSAGSAKKDDALQAEAQKRNP